MVVSWPPDETKNSIYAAIRLNDGLPVSLSSEEKKTGQVSLTSVKRQLWEKTADMLHVFQILITESFEQISFFDPRTHRQ